MLIARRLALPLFALACSCAAAAQGSGAGAAASPHAAAADTPLTLEQFEARPKLVVIVVVDQLRADYLTRFSSRFLPAAQPNGAPGGYRYLMSRGAYFPFATYGLLQAMTGPGHATVLTGSYPYRNGISLNLWCETGDDGATVPVYCVQDKDSPLVGGNPPLGARETPFSCTAPVVSGVSPRRLAADTVGDQLKTAGGGSRVVSISLKDRAAVLLGGHHADAALWFDPQGWGWISSRYYGAALPAWVEALNGKVRSRRGETVTFAPTGAPTGRAEGSDFGMSFRVGEGNSLLTPYGIEITVDGALAAVDALGLGKGPATDLLALSLSTHDWLGHNLGPNRIELEELTVAEDRQLARLFAQLQARLPHGLDDALIVLTADHGVPPAPGYVRALSPRGPAANDLAGFIDGDAVRAAADKALVKLYGAAPRGSWVNGTVDLNFWLDRPALAFKHLELRTAENDLKRVVQGLIPQAAFVLTRSEVERGEVPPALLGEHVRHGFIPGLNGDVLVVAKPFFMPEGDAVTHFADYSYDVTVPLILAGPSMKPGVYSTRANVIDLAPTLSFLLGLVPPAASEGRVLSEAIGRR